MPALTAIFKQIPWKGGLSTSKDPALISPQQCTVLDHVVYGANDSRKTRDGIDHDWDTGTNGSASVVGGHDFWYGNTTRTQLQVTVMSDGTMWSYQGGTRTQLTIAGTAWTTPLTHASMVTYGNKVFIAVDGANNVMKYWDGTNSVQDVISAYYGLTSISRSSSGTTRTLVFNEAFPSTVGATLVIALCATQAYNGTFTIASITTTNVANDTITYTASTSLTELVTTDKNILAGRQAPKPSFLSTHLNRLWCNDKTNPDRIMYSPTDDWTLWWGDGDSGGLYVGQGDGDPVGITSISPTFKYNLFVGKKTKLYRMEGDAPEDFVFEKISDSLGVESHASWVDFDGEDLGFVSSKGVHSIAATASYGDFESSYLSIDIQKTFNEQFSKSRLSYVQAAYLSSINSVAFAFSSRTSNTNDSLYLYNIPEKAWYTWSGLSCQALWVAQDADQKRFYLGTNQGRVSKTFNGTTYDIDNLGAQTPITLRITTGAIYPTEDAYTVTAFKRLILFFRPSGTYSLTVNVTIDNFALSSENSINYTGQGGALLGSTFILGISKLGNDSVLGPYTATIDGIGHGCKIDIKQTSGAIEIMGFGIEHERSGYSPEVFTN